MSSKKDLIGKTVLTDWTIESYLDSGGYGDVYLASQTRGRETFRAAIKRLMIPTDIEYRERLSNMNNDLEATEHYFRELYTEIISEIAVMHQLAGRSANIVAYFQNEIIEHKDPTRYEILIAMEYLKPLKKHASEKSMTVSEVLKMGIDVASALEVCHARGIMHRDIKESNIFLNDDENFKLGDFGLAKVLAESSKASSNVGSLAYKAPEVAVPFSNYDKTVDIYSLGIVMFKLFNHSRIPFTPQFPQKYGSKEENEALRRRFAGETLPRPQNAVQAVAEVIIKACAAKPENRYQTAAEFKMALQLLQKELSADELNRAVDKPVSTISENPEVYESTELFKFEETLEDDDGEEDIFASHKKPAPERPTSDQEKDRILWAQALKVGTEESIREYLEMENPVRAFSGDAWKWLDEWYWKAAVTADSIEVYEGYLRRGADVKRYEDNAVKSIAQLKEREKSALQEDDSGVHPSEKNSLLTSLGGVVPNGATSSDEVQGNTEENNENADNGVARKKRSNIMNGLILCVVLILVAAYLFNLVSSPFDFYSPTGSISMNKSYLGKTDSIVIPESINGVPVSMIGEGSFKQCEGVTSIIIPEGVSEIGDSAFYYCSGLTSITIPDSVTKIGDSVFEGCSSLTSITIPDSVTKIGDRAFAGCSGLTSIAIPDGVTEIGYNAFEDCKSLSSIIIPDTVIEGTYSFENCTSLVDVILPKGLSSITGHMFSNCTSLERVDIPENVTEIGICAFWNCTKLENVVIPSSVWWIGESAFEDCESLTDVTVPLNVSAIGGGAFSGCSNLVIKYPTKTELPVSHYGYQFEGCKEAVPY